MCNNFRNLAVLIFFFIYLMNLKILIPPYNLILIYFILGLSISFLKLNNNFLLNRKLFTQIVLLSSIFFAYILSSLLNDTFNFDYLKEIFFLNIVFLFSAYFFEKKYRNIDIDLVVTVLGVAVFFQLGLSLLAFLNTTVFNFIFSIIDVDNIGMEGLDRLNEARMVGVGKSFFGSGILNSFILIVLAFQISKYRKFIFLNSVLYIGIFILGFLSSRTTLIGMVLSLIFFLKNPVFLYRLIILIISFLILLIPFQNSIFGSKRILELIDFGFDMFFNFHNSQARDSLLVLWDMFLIRPESLKTWLIGDALFRSPEGGYYKDSDVGYIRIIFGSGVIGLIFFIYIHLYTIIKSSYFRQSKLLLISIISLFILLNFKGVANMYFIFILFYLLNSEQKENIKC